MIPWFIFRSYCSKSMRDISFRYSYEYFILQWCRCIYIFVLKAFIPIRFVCLFLNPSLNSGKFPFAWSHWDISCICICKSDLARVFNFSWHTMVVIAAHWRLYWSIKDKAGYVCDDLVQCRSALLPTVRVTKAPVVNFSVTANFDLSKQ